MSNTNKKKYPVAEVNVSDTLPALLADGPNGPFFEVHDRKTLRDQFAMAALIGETKKAADEIEKLRAALDKAADALHDAGCHEAWAAARAALKSADEIENLREAIEMARQRIDADDVIGAHQILTKALGEKE
jgi:hypothetical protein